MIDIKNTWTGGFEGAIRGMRNPYESHSKSDSNFDFTDTLGERLKNAMNEKGLTQLDVAKSLVNPDTGKPLNPHTVSNWFNGSTIRRRRSAIVSQLSKILDKPEDYFDVPDWGIGEADMALCKRLIKAGTEHRKFLRTIHVQTDVTAPRYWWAEAETYQYLLHDPMNYVRNSSSTMHLITKRHVTLDDFGVVNNEVREVLENVIIPLMNNWIDEYKNTDDSEHKNDILRSIKQILPESYNQMRTIDTNYECLLHVYGQRKNHRLSEWRDFCNWIESLPYMKEFINACS